MLEQTFLTDVLAFDVMFEKGFWPIDTGLYEMWWVERTDYVLRFADFSGGTNVLIKLTGPEIFP